MTCSLRIRWGMWPAHAAATALAAAMLALLATLALIAPASKIAQGNAHQATTPKISPTLTRLASDHPTRRIEAITQFESGTEPAIARELVRSAGGHVTGELHVINGLAVRISAAGAARLAESAPVRAVSLNARVKQQTLVNFDPNRMATSFNQSVNSANLWDYSTGRGVGVAVIDTGIAGDLPDFRVSQTSSSSRVIASAVVNPDAKSADDSYGHGTHVAGLIAGNSGYRPSKDPLRGKYAGSAPDARLISIKVSDEQGNATVLDVIYGLQFAVDFKDNYGIRVVNLSLESTEPESYKTDPLDAAAESAWFNGIVVVAAAGNRGSDPDAVDYAPGNDPYVISVGAVDDQDTKQTKDDLMADWSSRGTSQDGLAKPDLYAPGAHIVSTLAPGSAFESMCPSCIVSGQYIRAGGTSMAAPIVSGVVADILEDRPTWTPDQVKGAIIHTLRSLPKGGREINALNAYDASADKLSSNENLAPNTLINPASGGIDYTQAGLSRARWSIASGSLSADWAGSNWSCLCYDTTTESITTTRSRWSRSRWSTSWKL